MAAEHTRLKDIPEKTKRNGKAEKSPPSSESIFQMRRSGMKMAEIAARAGISRRTVSRILNPPISEGCTMRMKYMRKNYTCTLIDINFAERKLKIYNLTDDMLSRAFGVIEEPDWDDLTEFLKERCFSENRGDAKHILKILGLDSYDVFQIVERTKGKTFDDDMRIEFVYRERN